MDDEFEPTVDMMVNDFDDERTLDEAESCETAEDQRAEADLLQQEQNMPIEKLLAMYGGYRTGGTSAAQQQPTPVVKQDDDHEDEGQVEQREEHSSDESVKKEQDAKACAVSCAAAAADDRVDGDENDGDGDDDNDQAPEHMVEEEVTPTAVATAAAEVPNFQSRPAKRRRSTLSVLYPELSRKGGESGGGGERRTLRSEESSGQWEAGSSSDDDEEGDEGGSVDETSWRKTIMIGSVYQATVPGGLQPYTVSQPAVGGDQLLWQPATADNCTSSGGGDSAELVDSYLRRVEAARQRLAGETVAALPRGAHARDYEQPLYLLLQCSHDAELAFRRWSTEGATLAGWPAAYMTLWSEDECASFENGLRFYGKDFFTIQQQRVRTRSVGELVQFYYLWKKTERHDVFANRAKLEKRKYALTPGVTDYMERFIDEQQRETSVQRSAGGQEGASLQVLMTSSQDSPTHTPTPTAVSQHQWLDASLARDLTGSQIAARGAMAPLVPP